MSKSTLIIFIAGAILITLFIFYPDEGFYYFKWKNFLLCLIPLLLGQLLVYRLIPLKYNTTGRVLLSVLTGTTLGLLFVFRIIL